MTAPPPNVPDRLVDSVMEAMIMRGFDVYARLRDREGSAVLRVHGDAEWTNKIAVAEAARIAASFPTVAIAVVRKVGTGDLEFRVRGRG